MLTIQKKFFFIKVHEHWYQCRYKWYDIFGLHAFLHVKNLDSKPAFMVNKISHTVENDLTLSEEELFGAFSKQFRNQIKGAEKEGVVCEYNKDIERFVPFFNDFARSKGINGTSVRRLQEMGDNLLLSAAFLDGKMIVAHSYFYDRESQIVHTFQSASIRFEDCGLDKNLIGKANKLLHFKDMLHFKAEGVKTYDFGGYSPPENKRELNGINDFKLNFGGKVVECKNYLTIPYFVLKFLADKLGFLGKG